MRSSSLSDRASCSRSRKQRITPDQSQKLVQYRSDTVTEHFVTDPGTRFEKYSSGNMILSDYTPGLRIRIRIRIWIRINLSCWIRNRIQEGKNDTHKKKCKIFMFWSAGCCLLRAEGFSCSLDVLYVGLGISKLQFLIKQIKMKFPAVNFFQFLVIKPRIRIRDPDPQLEKIQDPDPYPDPH